MINKLQKLLKGLKLIARLPNQQIEMEAISRTLLYIHRTVLYNRYLLSINKGFPINYLCEPVQVKETKPLEVYFSQLQQLAPNAFPVWNGLVDVNKRAYKNLPIDSCSVEGHPFATLFKYFLYPYLKGNVLDIGCGPQPIPVYLTDYPIENIYGLDPLSEQSEHPFHFSKGVAEFLPYGDRQFDVVIAATSLDHVLLLDRTLYEVSRVLKNDGIFAIWLSFIEGSPVYNPYKDTVSKVDEYHLFHFSRDWFFEMMANEFTVVEEYGPVNNTFNSTFIVFRKKV